MSATAGEGSHPASPTHDPERAGDPAPRPSSSVPRRCSPAAPRWSASGTPTAALADLEEELVAAIVAAVGHAGERTLLAAPWRHDGHPDHEAVGRAAAVAARRTDARLVEYPVWMWHWGTEQDLPWPDARVVRLDDTGPRGQAGGRRRARQPGRTRSPAGPATRCCSDRRCSSTSTATSRSSSRRAGPPATTRWNGCTATATTRGTSTAGTSGASAPSPWPACRASTTGGCSRSAARWGRWPSTSPGAATPWSPSTPARRRSRPPEAGSPGSTTSTYAVPRSRPSGPTAASTWCRCRRSATSSAPRALAELVSRALGALAPDGHLLLCHWRHDLVGWPLTGPLVHDAFLATGARVLAEHHDPDFVLHVLGGTP